MPFLVEPRLRSAQDAAGEPVGQVARLKQGHCVEVWATVGRGREAARAEGFGRVGPVLAEKVHPEDSPGPFIHIVLWSGPVHGLSLEDTSYIQYSPLVMKKF